MPSDLDPGEHVERQDESKSLTDSMDIHSDVTKIIDEEGSDGVNSLQSVYNPTTTVLTYQPRQGLSRYKPSLKHLFPVRLKRSPKSSMPVDQSGCFSFVLFSWLTPLVWKAYQTGIKAGDLYQCSPFESSKVNGSRLSSIRERLVKERISRRASFRLVLFRFICTRFLVACLAYFLCLVFGFVGPTVFMRMLLENVQLTDGDLVEGLLWVLGLLLCEGMRVLCFVTLWAVNCRTATRTGAGLSFLLFQKLINLKTTTGRTTGEIINLFANDGHKIMMWVYTSPLIIGGPLVMLAAIIYTWWLLGAYSLVGVGVFTLGYALQFAVSKLNSHFRKKSMKMTDKRVSLMSEVLTFIKLIKFYAWESSFADKISAVRQKERKYLEVCQFTQMVSASMALLIPSISTICTILAYTMAGNDMTASTAYTLMMVNFVTAHGLKTIPLCVRDFVNGFVAVQRLESYFELDEQESYTSTPSKPGVAIFISKAYLTWPKPPAPDPNVQGKQRTANADAESDDDAALVTAVEGPLPILKDITFTLPKGRLLGVCGPVGSGKSSLLSALLGQMQFISGQVSVRNSCSYVSQHPWILNTSVRENILFGEAFNSKRYYEAVFCCSLTDDLASLPKGDLTEIGERGMTLSGGQRQRISLARALYANKELNLFDDPLSAVDPKVAHHIFHHAMKGTSKSILFVSNQVEFLKLCDSVIFMKDGTIVDEGPHDTLVNIDSDYAQFVATLSTTERNWDNNIAEPQSPSRVLGFARNRSPSHPKSITSLASSVSDSVDDSRAPGHLMSDELISSGNILCDTYRTYMSAAGGYMLCSFVLVWFVVQAAAVGFSKLWLGHWISQCYYTDDNGITSHVTHINAIPDAMNYQIVYGSSIAAMLIFSLVIGFLFVKTTFRASSHLHNSALSKILCCPMQVFETIPVGRILNIFTRDLDEVDVQLPTVMDAFLVQLMEVLVIILVMSYAFPWFYLAFGAMAFFFFIIYRMFRVALRDFKRFENVSRSPVYSHIGSTIQGLSTIRAYRKQEAFMEMFCQLVDKNSSPQYLYYSSLRWLAARMDFMGLVITLLAALLACCLKEHIGPAYSGLALALAMQLSGSLQYLVRSCCDVESHFTSVERIQYYMENLETEAPALVSNNRAAPDWPTRGRISFREVNMRYRPSLPLALRNVTFDISPQEKIGVMGRTGAGKSSLGVALFRLVELSSGTIHIDGLNISKLGLEDVRSRMSIIPQDPILFCGTLRYNLDPLGQFDDSQLWDSLGKTYMKDEITCLKGGLDTPVEDNGENFSVGERQLLCLARALLRKSKIVVLDEATASVDLETDNLIQRTIRDVFADCTVIIIAHRLNTVRHCNRVMVLHDGKVVEFDSPTVLLSNPSSWLSRLNETTVETED